MKSRKIAMLICAVALAVAGVAAARHEVSVKSAVADPAPKPIALASASNPALLSNSVQKDSEVPKHVVYGLFFGEMLALKKKAEERERKGLESSALRDFSKKRANLNDDQALKLDSIAVDFNDRVVKINDKAKRIIDRERARHPHGKLNDGEALPIPPQALKDLEQERKETLLQAREQVRSAFGENEFKRFDDFIQQDIDARTKGTSKHKP